MATLGERVQRVEDGWRADHETIHGGPNVKWEQSIRGRLHRLDEERSAREHLRQAGLARFSKGEIIVGLMIALAQLAISFATLVAVHG